MLRLPVAVSFFARSAPGRRVAAALGGVAGVLVVLLAGPAAALAPDLGLGACTVETWGLRDGLTGSMVRGITQTDDGYLWVAGFAGVTRHDGARMVRLELEPPFDIMGMLAHPNGVWVVPRRGPLVCTSAGSLIPCPPGTPPLPENARVSAVAETASGDALIGTDMGLLLQQGDRFAVIEKARDIVPGDFSAIHLDRWGKVWLGNDRGLYRETDDGRFALYPEGAPPATPRSFFPTHDGRLHVLTDRELMELDAKGNRIRLLPVPPELGVGSRAVVIEDRDGSLWVGGGRGLARVRDGHFTIFTKADGLPDDAVTALYEDREGSLWVGTRSGSLAQFTDRVVRTNLGPRLVAEESVESVTEDNEGALWAGNYRGLLRVKNGVERLYATTEGGAPVRVYVVAPARAGGVWAGTALGLVRFVDGRVVPVAKGPQTYAIYEDPSGKLWLGGADGLYEVRGDQMVRLPTAASFVPAQVRGIAHDDQGQLWVTSVGGLGRVVNGKLEAAAPVPGTRIAEADRGLTRDSDGTLWFGAGPDLVRLRKGHFQTFVPALASGRDWLFQVLPDDHGYIWFATSRTISRVARSTLDAVAASGRNTTAVVSFDMTDTRGEIAARRARNAGAWKARDGRLWFATLRGMVTIDPRQVRINTRPPSVLIERAMVDGRSALGAAQAFPPGPGNLEFQFAGVTLLEPHKAMHRYRLEGFDKDWIDAGTRRVAYYTNIPPGRYRFQVMASNADGVWNEAGASLALTLSPQVYQTAWFYLLVALALGGVGFYLYRARLTRLRGQYLAVFAERSRVARELHDSLLQGMSAVALEIANIRTALPHTAVGAASRLEAVEDALTQSLEETRRFVWNLREQPTGSGDLGLALTRLAGRLTEGRGVSCSVEVEGTAVHLSHDAQGTLFKIAQEAISNALRHAEARTIRVHLRYREREAELLVADDGRGFDPATAQGPDQGHFGLVGMHERARRVGARLDVSSTPGTGTRVVFVMTVGAAPARAAQA